MHLERDPESAVEEQDPDAERACVNSNSSAIFVVISWNSCRKRNLMRLVKPTARSREGAPPCRFPRHDQIPGFRLCLPATTPLSSLSWTSKLELVVDEMSSSGRGLMHELVVDAEQVVQLHADGSLHRHASLSENCHARGTTMARRPAVPDGYRTWGHGLAVRSDRSWCSYESETALRSAGPLDEAYSVDACSRKSPLEGGRDARWGCQSFACLFVCRGRELGVRQKVKLEERR